MWLCALTAWASQTFTIDAPERGKRYQVTTTARGIALTVRQKWLYQPSVVKLAADRYVMLFVTCNASGSACDVRQQGLYTASSPDGVTFTLDNNGQPILSNPPGVCDFVAPRPIQHNGSWYVYFQGSESCADDPSIKNNAIYLATGESLTAGGLNWVLDPANPAKARRAVRINPKPGCPDNYDPAGQDECTGAGIGEDHQWFNVSFGEYLGASWSPILTVFNNWNYRRSTVGMSAALAAATDGSRTDYWYGPSNTPWTSEAGGLYPDVMLGGTDGMAAYGSPAIKFAESCLPGTTRNRPLKFVGYWADPYPYNGQTGVYRRTIRPQGPLPVAIETITESGAAAVNGSGFRPRLARNPFGFLDPEPGTEPKQWRTFLYYTVSPINNSSSETCGGYTASKTTSQSLGVTEVVITEIPR